MAANIHTPEADNEEQTNGPSIWIRALYMLLFALIFHLAEAVIGLVMVVQFILKAATGDTNSNLLNFGEQLSQYLAEIVQFQTFNTEDKPFPFGQWPQANE